MTTSATETRDSGRQVGSGATSNWTVDLARQRARSSRIRPSSARSRSTAARTTGSGFGDGWLDGERLELGDDLDRLAVALVALHGGVALGDDPLGLAGLLEQAPALGQGGLRVGPPVARGRTACRGRARAGRGRARPGRAPACACSTASSATLRRPGLRSPRVVSSWSALSSFLRGPAGAAVGAADRRLEPIAQGALVARQVAQLEMVDRRGRAEEALGRDAGQLGHDLVGERRVRDRLAVVVEPDRALRAGERLLEGPDLLAVLVVLLELDGDDRAGLGRRAPRSERLELAGRARRPPGEGELERALDGGLAGLVRAADDGQPRGEARCRRSGSAGNRARCSRRILTATPRGRPAAGGRAGARRGVSAASAVGAGRLRARRSAPRGRG